MVIPERRMPLIECSTNACIKLITRTRRQHRFPQEKAAFIVNTLIDQSACMLWCLSRGQLHSNAVMTIKLMRRRWSNEWSAAPRSAPAPATGGSISFHETRSTQTHSHALYCATCINFTSGGHLMLPESSSVRGQSSEKYKRRQHDVSSAQPVSFLPPLMFAKCAWHLPQICFANASAPFEVGKSTDFTLLRIGVDVLGPWMAQMG